MTVTPSTASTQTDVLRPLAGSHSTLVFSAHSWVAGDTDPANRYLGDGPSGRDVLYARSRSGHLSRLGVAPQKAEQYSVVGTVVTAGRYTWSEYADYYTNQAYAWRIGSGKRRLITLGKKAQYLSAGPGGIVYATHDGVLKLRTLAGRTTVLGRPFTGDGDLVPHFGTADARGIVVSGIGLSGRMAYLTFAKPHTITQLNNGASLATNASSQCEAVAGRYAACTADDNSDTFPPFQVMVVPLRGGAAILPPGQGGSFPALSGATLVWTGRHDTVSSAPASRIADVTTGSQRVYGRLVSAYGEAIGASADKRTLFSARSADRVRTLVGPRRSAVSVDAFAMRSGRLIYADDQRVHSRSGLKETLFKRSLSTHGGTLRVSPPRIVTTGKGQLAGSLVGITRWLAVYATPDGNKMVTLHVRSPEGNKTLHEVDPFTQPQVYGHEVLFNNLACRCAKVFNSTTRTAVAVRPVNTSIHGVASTTALWGHDIAYAATNGTVYRKNFVTGHKVKLAGPVRRPRDGIHFAVFEYRNWVGWHAQLLPEGSRPHFVPRNRIRNARTLGPLIRLGHRLYSLTCAGALLDSTEPSFTSHGYSLPGSIPRPTTFWLRSYSGRTSRLLENRSYVAGPKIAGDVIAWAGRAGVLHAAKLANNP